MALLIKTLLNSKVEGSKDLAVLSSSAYMNN